MAELLVRFGDSDVALLERVLAAPAAQARPDRVVLDATVSAVQPRFSSATRRAGVPLLVDPLTYLLQDFQHAAAKWAHLPYARAAAASPSELQSPVRQAELVSSCIDHQLGLGATAIIPPYVHIDRIDGGWLDVQVGLWRRTRRYLDQQDLALPVVAVTAVGWRLLSRNCWPAGANRLLSSILDLGADEIALAASKVDQGSHPDQRLVDLVATIDHMRSHRPVLAWRQGLLGEAAVAAGARGYETGLGWREVCDLGRAMTADRRPVSPDAAFGVRPVYIPVLGRSIPKRSLEVLLGTRLSPQFLCMDYQCCPEGQLSLLGDARAHALTSRARSLHALDCVDRHAWRWRRLADCAADGLELAGRINRLAESRPAIKTVNTNALTAIQAVADNRRQTLRRRAA